MLGYYLPDADFSYPGELPDESAPDLTGYELFTELDFGSMPDTYITTAYPDEQRGTAWEDGNQRQQKIYNTTSPTELHDILAFQTTYSGSGSKGWWISKRAGGLVSEYAHRSAAVLGLRKGYIVIFEATNSVDGTLRLTDGNGNPDGPFTFTRSGDASKYYCTMTSNGQIGFCAEWRYTGAIKRIQIYRKTEGDAPSGITLPSIQQRLPAYKLNGIPSVGLPTQNDIYIIGDKKVIRKNR